MDCSKEGVVLPLPAENQAEANSRVRLRRRRALCCGIASAGSILITALVLAVLAVTVFKTKNARVTVNSVKLDDIRAALDVPRLRVRLNATLEVDLSVKNPNRASFKFGNGSTLVYYRGTTVAEALIPAGEILADRTVNMTSTLTILGDRFLADSSLYSDVLAGVLPLSTSTRLAGRVNVLNIFKHHAVSYTFCSLSIFVWNQTIKESDCAYRTKL